MNERTCYATLGLERQYIEKLACKKRNGSSAPNSAGKRHVEDCDCVALKYVIAA